MIELAVPWPRHSRVLFPRVSVNSSIRVRVINDSINPTAARMKERSNESQGFPIQGIEKAYEAGQFTADGSHVANDQRVEIQADYD